MEQNLIDIYDLIEHAIDNAFEGNMNLKFYEYLKDNKTKKHKQLREGYGFIPKPQARKIKNYLQNILDDATRYSNDRRPGRRKKDSK